MDFIICTSIAVVKTAERSEMKTKINPKYLENRYKYYCDSCETLVSEKIFRIGDYGMCRICIEKKTKN